MFFFVFVFVEDRYLIGTEILLLSTSCRVMKKPRRFFFWPPSCLVFPAKQSRRLKFQILYYVILFFFVANCVMCYNNCGEQIAQAVNHIIILINVPFLVFVCLFGSLSLHLFYRQKLLCECDCLAEIELEKWMNIVIITSISLWIYGLWVSEGYLLGVSRFDLNSRTED